MKEKNKWYPKSFTATLLSVTIGILTGVLINLFTGSFPTDTILFSFFIVAIIFFVISSIATWIILNIRIKIDEEFSNRRSDDKNNEKKMDDIWKATLKEDEILINKQKFILWKRVWVISILIGLFLLFVVNYKNRIYNIKQENRRAEYFRKIIVPLEHLNSKLYKQNVLILKLNDSIKSINKKKLTNR